MAGSGGTLTWSTTSVTLAIGETKTVNYTTTFNQVDSATFAPLIASVATFTRGTNKIDLTGTAAGTVTIAANTTVAYETVTTNALTITVMAEDQNFLNERGLAHFWGNIDSAKQNKLTAGSHITINNDTISATQPTVNNATLTIKQNTTTLGTFTANASTGTTVTISTPTRTTIYSNNSGTNANFSTTSAMSNYDDVEITFRDGNSNYATRTVPGSSGSFVLDISHPGGSSTVYWYISRFIVSGTNITIGANNVRKAISTTVSSTNSQDIYITKMVGIKY